MQAELLSIVRSAILDEAAFEEQARSLRAKTRRRLRTAEIDAAITEERP